jgi:hypothetical protein
VTLIPFGEYRPDVADYEGQHTKNVNNVVPQGDGYAPFLSFAALTQALSASCRGIFYALKNDGTISVFAATSTNLYNLNNTNQTWTNVSLGGGPYAALPTGGQWQFKQFNNFIFAVQQNVAPQVFDLTSSSAFANLGGSPPLAAYIAIINRFVVLGGIASPNVYRMQWSGLNATTTWTSGVNQSDFQDLTDGGIFRGLAGNDLFGLVFQDRTIRRLTYSPGSPYVFGIDRIAQNEGLYAPYSIIDAGSRIFYCSTQGFKMWVPGMEATPIGKERVDRTFFNNVDSANLQLMIGCADPVHQRVYWAYKSVNGAAGLFDTILVYDWVLDRWSKLNITGEYLAPLATPGMTLEAVDAAYDTAAPMALSAVTTSTSAVTFGLVGHGLTAGQGIIFPNAIVGLSASTPYYVKAASLTSSSFNVSATGGVGTLAGTAVGTTSTATSTTVSATFIKSSIETISIGSLDNISISQLPTLGVVNSSHMAGLFTGPALEATMESAEHGNAPRRIYVNGFTPITDAPAANIFGSVSGRERQENATVQSTEKPVSVTGEIPARVSTRYARGKIRITAGSTWTFAAGIEPDVRPEGLR